MWVEITGLPGVGKTVLVNRHLVEIQEQFQIIRSNSSSVWTQVLSHLIYTLSYQKIVDDKSFCQKLAYRSSLRIGRRRRTNCFFWDSGIIQPLLENLIVTNFKNKKEKIELIRRTKLPDIVLYIQDNLTISLERELNRPHRRFPFDCNELYSRYRKAEVVIEEELLPLVSKIYKLTPEDRLNIREVMTHEKVS
jgi:hypothetical protein